MTITFKEFADSNDESKDEQKALEVVRKGMNMQRGSDFWDDLISLCGNAEGMSKLLGVPREKITGLAGRIGKLKDKAIDTDETSSKDRLIKTGK
jgi:hypothetical protein